MPHSDKPISLLAKRLELGLTQTDMAARAKVSQGAISLLEREGVGLGPGAVAKVASAYGVTVSELAHYIAYHVERKRDTEREASREAVA